MVNAFDFLRFPHKEAHYMSHQNYPEASIRDFYNVLFRYKRKILVFFFSVVIVVTFGTLLSSEVYQSEAELMVRLGRESVTLDPTATTGQVVSIGPERENEINSEAEILNSRDLAEKVVDSVGVDLILEGPQETLEQGDPLVKVVSYWVKQAVKIPVAAIAKLLASNDALGPADQLKKRDKAVESLLKALKIEAPKKSNIISIAYKTSDPKLAHDVVDRLIGFYLEKHINAHRTSGSYQFFDQQKETLQSSLAQTEERLKCFKEQDRHGLDRTAAAYSSRTCRRDAEGA